MSPPSAMRSGSSPLPFEPSSTLTTLQYLLSTGCWHEADEGLVCFEFSFFFSLAIVVLLMIQYLVGGSAGGYLNKLQGGASPELLSSFESDLRAAMQVFDVLCGSLRTETEAFVQVVPAGGYALVDLERRNNRSPSPVSGRRIESYGIKY